MLDIKLQKDFKLRFKSLRPETQRAVLATLKKLSESPELEPDIRIPERDLGEICVIRFEEGFVLAYCIVFAKSTNLVTPGLRTPLYLVANLANDAGYAVAIR